MKGPLLSGGIDGARPIHRTLSACPLNLNQKCKDETDKEKKQTTHTQTTWRRRSMSESMLCAACRVGSRLLDRILTRPDTTLQGRVAEDKEGIRSISVSGFKEEKERERERGY